MRDRDDRASSRWHANGCLTAGAVEAKPGPRSKHMLRCEELGLLNIVTLAAAPGGAEATQRRDLPLGTLGPDDDEASRHGRTGRRPTLSKIALSRSSSRPAHTSAAARSFAATLQAVDRSAGAQLANTRCAVGGGSRDPLWCYGGPSCWSADRNSSAPYERSSSPAHARVLTPPPKRARDQRRPECSSRGRSNHREPVFGAADLRHATVMPTPNDAELTAVARSLERVYGSVLSDVL
jgi:hypothetical protein